MNVARDDPHQPFCVFKEHTLEEVIEALRVDQKSRTPHLSDIIDCTTFWKNEPNNMELVGKLDRLFGLLTRMDRSSAYIAVSGRPEQNRKLFAQLRRDNPEKGSDLPLAAYHFCGGGSQSHADPELLLNSLNARLRSHEGLALAKLPKNTTATQRLHSTMSDLARILEREERRILIFLEGADRILLRSSSESVGEQLQRLLPAAPLPHGIFWLLGVDAESNLAAFASAHRYDYHPWSRQRNQLQPAEPPTQPLTIEQRYLNERAGRWSQVDWLVDTQFTPLQLIIRRPDPLGHQDETHTYHGLGELLDEQSAYSVFTLLGAPGAGKTILLNHLERIQSQVSRDCLEERPLVPIYLPLNDYSADEKDPLTWLESQWQAITRGMESLQSLLTEGRLLLLDGLNEMRESGEEYAGLVAAWGRFLKHHFPVEKGNRAIISCRAHDYIHTLESEGFTVPNTKN
ncbi:MAG: hypothetical protein ABW168_03185 [Sedimenticola sp.]